MNIRSLAAYEQARSHCGSVTLEGKQLLVVFYHSRAASLRALRLYAAYRQSRYLAWRADQINLSTKRNNCRKLYRERQYPILRLGESQRGVREPLTVAKNKGHPGECPYFFWRRKRDSNPRGFGPNGFQGVIHRRILEENNGL